VNVDSLIGIENVCLMTYLQCFNIAQYIGETFTSVNKPLKATHNN